MNITQALHRAVARQPNEVATICGGRRHTFSQFQDRVSRLASALLDLGVQEGIILAAQVARLDGYGYFLRQTGA